MYKMTHKSVPIPPPDTRSFPPPLMQTMPNRGPPQVVSEGHGLPPPVQGPEEDCMQNQAANNIPPPVQPAGNLNPGAGRNPNPRADGNPNPGANGGGDDQNQVPQRQPMVIPGAQALVFPKFERGVVSTRTPCSEPWTRPRRSTIGTQNARRPPRGSDCGSMLCGRLNRSMNKEPTTINGRCSDKQPGSDST